MEEQLVRFHLKCLCKLLQSRQRRCCVAAFDPRHVRSQEPGPLFDVRLGEPLGLSNLSQSFSYVHGCKYSKEARARQDYGDWVSNGPPLPTPA